AKESRLLQAIRHEGDLEMPPKKPKLSDAVIADFAKWIELGAPDPREGQASATGPIDFKKAREFWAFEPVKSPQVPEVRSSKFEIRNPIDAFVLTKLQAC